MAQVTSIVRDRRPEIGIVAILAVSVALLSAPTAFGAGDPIASGTFSFKRSSGFKHQLKSNHVKLKPKAFSIKAGSSLDPITGAGTLKVGKITFKKGNKKVVYSNAKATLGANGGKGNIKGSTGKLFSLSGGTVTRNGFGATVSGVKVKLLKGAAKKINKKLGLHSLHKGRAGKLTVSEQPQTVAVTSGFVFVNVPCGFLPALQGGFSALCPGSGADPNTVAAKQPAHCIGPADGVAVVPGDPNNPARLSTVTATDPVLGPPPSGVGAYFRFPVTGGTVGPSGKDGVIQVSGGVRLMSGYTSLDVLGFGPRTPGCDSSETPGASTSHSYLDTTNLAPNLALLNIQADTFIGGTTPGCNFTTPNTPPGCGPPLGGAGEKGIAIGQSIDPSGISASATPPSGSTPGSVTINGALITNTGVASLVLNGLFPNASGNSSKDFVAGDKFGISHLTVSTR